MQQEEGTVVALLLIQEGSLIIRVRRAHLAIGSLLREMEVPPILSRKVMVEVPFGYDNPKKRI